MGILQILPDITNTDGQPTIYPPLILIICISMLKDYLEDYKRKKSDNEENNKIINLYSDGRFVQAKSWELRIGDIIKVF